MNPIFVFLVIIGAALLWLLLSGLYRIIGSIVQRLADDARRAMFEDNQKNASIMGRQYYGKERKDEGK